MKMAGCFLVFAMAITACRKPYNPPAIAAPGSYLVVEGAINAGSDSTIIRLSRTVSLSADSIVNPVRGATVALESDRNAVFPFTEVSGGKYVSAGLNLNTSHTYRLSIKTNNETYYSDYVPVLNAPPIDSLYFMVKSDGINIYSAAHDPTNAVKYYRWDYVETWIIHSYFDSGFVSNGDTVLVRQPNQRVTTCWSSDTSSTILIASSAALAKDVIANNPIISIVSSSEKLGGEYSILLKQYALTPDAYNFWRDLKKNTEELGSIFDAQPSENNGNIHSATNPSERVIGYISIGNSASKRIFIRNQQLPAWPIIYPYPNCMIDSLLYVYHVPGTQMVINQVNEEINYNKGHTLDPLIPIEGITPYPGLPPIGYTASTRDCADCTVRGTNRQPSYWQY
jgi:hypothetical protein